MFRGRDGERAVLDRVLNGIRAGHGGVLVVRGEAGTGKSALLEYAIQAAADCQVARTGGVQSEMELAFAGLQQLCSGFLGRLDRLPDPQRDALRAVFGLGSGGRPDRYLVGLGLLSLLSEAARDVPLVCVIDDAQWLDHASVQALAFAAHRLQADRVALLFARRSSGAPDDLTGLPELTLTGLSVTDAYGLLASALPWLLDRGIADRIVAETQGNPLALLELPRGLTPETLAGGFQPTRGLPLSGRIEQSFLRRVHQLPGPTRLLLLLAAAEPVGDPSLLWRAAGQLGIKPDAVLPAEADGLLTIGTMVTFRHPLVRSAVYQSAPPQDRRRMHAALAEATDPQADPDRRAWHRAQAALGPDEDVAGELEHSAGRAQARGGLAAAAGFLERAASLTLDPARRSGRALTAARTMYLAGAPDRVLRLLAAAEAGPLDELQRAQADLLRGQVAFVVDRGGDAPRLLQQAARRIEPLDAGLARDTYLEALSAALFAGDFSAAGTVRRVAEAAYAAPLPPPPERASDLLLDGLAVLIIDGYDAAVPRLRRALGAFGRENLPVQTGLRWMWLAARAAGMIWDDGTWDALTARSAQLTRDAGAFTMLPVPLAARIALHALAGDLATAAVLADELLSIVRTVGLHPGPYGQVLVAAWQGREPEASELIEANAKETASRGEGMGLAIVQWAQALLHNSCGRYDEALVAAAAASEYPAGMLYVNWGRVELIEAAARTGNAERGAEALGRLAESTRAAGTDWALGIEARSRALLSEGEAAEHLYREAVGRLGRTRFRAELARAHLLYGEWLRRERRPLDARGQLRTASEMFEKMGAESFASRARTELAATGGRARKRPVVAGPGELTPQETRIATLASEGLSNAQIAAQLFISASTVDFHLRKVFQKLGVSSRTRLHLVLPKRPAILGR